MPLSIRKFNNFNFIRFKEKALLPNYFAILYITFQSVVVSFVGENISSKRVDVRSEINVSRRNNNHPLIDFGKLPNKVAKEYNRR